MAAIAALRIKLGYYVTTMSEIEKREHPRIDLTGSGITGTFVNLAEFLDFFAENISESGMQIVSKQFFPEHSSFHFKLELGDDDEPFEGMGQVMWVKRGNGNDGKATMGVKFVHLTDSSKNLVEIIERAHSRLKK